MAKRLYTLLLLALLGIPLPAISSHILGGELSYRCLGNGVYEFSLQVYRDCSGVSFTCIESIPMFSNAGLSVPLLFVGTEDVSYRCPEPSSPFRCHPATTGTGPLGTVARFTYQNTLNLSSLGPTPPQGYDFFIRNAGNAVGCDGIPCCRPMIQNISGATQAFMVRMRPYTDPQSGLVLSPAQLCDNAPRFASNPNALLILNPLDTIYLQNVAEDIDFDSISYSIGYPLGGYQGSPSYLSYSPPYSLQNPVPGLIPPPFVNADDFPINRRTGEMILRSEIPGRFVMMIQLTSWRCGQPISEVYRDFAFINIANPVNAPPIYDPFAPLNTQQRAPKLQLDLGNGPLNLRSIERRYYAGDTIFFSALATDSFPLIRNDVYAPDLVSLAMRGSQLSTSNQLASGCENPPCATLQAGAGGMGIPPVAMYSASGVLLGYGFQNQISSQNHLRWETSCANVARGNSCQSSAVSTAQFSLLAYDNNCPVIGSSAATVRISLQELPRLPAPQFSGLSAEVMNGPVQLYFEPRIDTSSIDPLDLANFGHALTTAQLLHKSAQRRLQAFGCYRIYKAPDASGPFVLIDSLTDPFANSYIDYNFRDNGEDWHYYISTVSGCHGYESAPSEVFRVMRTYLRYLPSQGLVALQWDSMGRPYPANCTGKYTIWRGTESATAWAWQAVDSLNDLYRTDRPDGLCESADSVIYRISLSDANGRQYFSLPGTDNIRDKLPPTAPYLQQCSVDTGSGLVQLVWEAGDEGDLFGFEVLIGPDADSNNMIRLDLLQAPGLRNYTDIISGPVGFNAPWYRIRAFDSCGNFSTFSNPISPIRLQLIPDSCSGALTLAWDRHRQLGLGHTDYKIYRKKPAQGYEDLANRPGGMPINRYIDTAAVDRNVVYRYVVAAQHANGAISWSMPAEILFDRQRLPTYMYIRSVSITNEPEALPSLRLEADGLEDLQLLSLERSADGLRYTRLQAWEASDLPLNNGRLSLQYTDPTANSSRQTWYYRFVFHDWCTAPRMYSNSANSICLQGKSLFSLSNQLEWNAYIGWGTTAYELQLERRFDELLSPFTPLAHFNPVQRPFIDNDPVLADQLLASLYRLQAIGEAAEHPQFRDTLYSNVVALKHEPRIFMPSAFLPEGVNRELRPQGFLIDEAGPFEFKVYNRWGQVQFATLMYGQAWDGRGLDGEWVAPGAYAYTIRFTGIDGQEYQSNGMLQLIR
ncbi:MAG: gliding motility-associated C-terminal domain-containing protein [Bacteroidia bacterium]